MYDLLIGFSWETDRELKMPNYIERGLSLSEIQSTIRDMSEKDRSEMESLVNETPEPVFVLLDKYGKCKDVNNFVFWNTETIPNGIVIPSTDDENNVFMENINKIDEVEKSKDSIGIDLLTHSKNVDSIVVYLTSYDEDRTFNNVRKLSMTIYNTDTMEALYVYNVPEDKSDSRSQKLITIKITDRIKGSWSIYVDGKESKEHMRELANKHICL